jgi:hypothetical protein
MKNMKEGKCGGAKKAQGDASLAEEAKMHRRQGHGRASVAA